MIIIIIMCITIQYVVLSHDEINNGVTMEAMLCTREGTNDHFFHLSEQFKSRRQKDIEPQQILLFCEDRPPCVPTHGQYKNSVLLFCES